MAASQPVSCASGRRCGRYWGLWQRWRWWHSRRRRSPGRRPSPATAESSTAMATAQSSSAARPTMNCTDIRGFNTEGNTNTWGGRFYDNGDVHRARRARHDVPVRQPGSGNDVTWTRPYRADPSAAPTDANPGHDVAHWFELSPRLGTRWRCATPTPTRRLSCTPESDTNAPDVPSGNQCANGYPGGGSAFMEMQFYPPGFPPFVDGIGCDDTHWCAALTIDSLECTYGFATCNTELRGTSQLRASSRRTASRPGPPSPQKADLDTDTPEPGDAADEPGRLIQVHMFDAPVPGERGQRAFEVVIDDLTTHQIGLHAGVSHQRVREHIDQQVRGHAVQLPARVQHRGQGQHIPWAALQTNISTEYETGHWESCASLSEERRSRSTSSCPPNVQRTVIDMS